jgi:hypothetical protein
MYHTSVVFLVAAALLLPPELIVLIPLVQAVPEWLKERYPWQIQGFNISNYTLNALAAWGAADLVNKHGAGVIANPDARFAVAGLVACVVFVTLNHLIFAVILKLGRGHNFRESGLFSAEGISVDLVLTILGVSLAAFWNWNPWLIFAALSSCTDRSASRSSRRRRVSTRRPVSTTPGTSRRRSRPRSPGPRASNGRCR